MKQITLFERASQGHHYDVFVFEINGSDIKHRRLKVKISDTPIRVTEGVVGELLEGGIRTSILAKELAMYHTMINRMRSKKGFSGEFVLEADGKGTDFFFRTVFKVAA